MFRSSFTCKVNNHFSNLQILFQLFPSFFFFNEGEPKEAIYFMLQSYSLRRSTDRLTQTEKQLDTKGLVINTYHITSI